MCQLYLNITDWKKENEQNSLKFYVKLYESQVCEWVNGKFSFVNKRKQIGDYWLVRMLLAAEYMATWI